MHPRNSERRSEESTASTVWTRGRVLLAAACALLVLGGAFAGPALAAENLHAGDASPGSVDEESKVTHTFTYQVENVSNDGNTDELFLTFPDSVNASASALSSFSGNVTNTQTGESISISSSPSIVDGPDGDGIKDSVRIAVQPSGQNKSVDMTVKLTGDVTWPDVDSDTTLPVEAAVVDSKYPAAGPSQVTSVAVANTDATSSGSADFTVGIDSTNVPITAGEEFTTQATVTNDGTATGTQTVSLSVDGSQVDSTSASLDAGESTTVSLSWATGSGDAGNHMVTVASANDSAETSVTVEESAQANVGVTFDSAESPVTAGDTVETTATVTNDGDASATQTVSLSVDGSQVDSTSVSLGPSESTTVGLSWTTGDGDASDHTLTVATANDSAQTGVTVQEAAAFEVSVSAVESPVRAGETATVDVTVRNTGGTDGTQEFALAVNGSEVNTTSVTLAGGESRSVSLSWATSEGDAGTYTVTVRSGTASASDTLVVEADTDYETVVRSGSISPNTVEESTKVGQRFVYRVENVSNDGSTDALFLTFPDSVNASAGALSSFSGNVTDAGTGASVSISSSPSIVDGPDGDGVQETVRIGVQPEGERTAIDVQVAFTGDVTWPAVDGDSNLVVTGGASDSAFGTGDPRFVSTVAVQDSSETDDSSEDATPDGSTPTPDDSGDTDDSSDVDDSTTMDSTETTDETTSGSSGPGFGIAAVLTALGAVLVATRLRDA